MLCRFCSLFRRLSFFAFFSSFYLILDTFFVLFLRFVLARLLLRGLTLLFRLAIPLLFILLLRSNFLRLFFRLRISRLVFDSLFLFVRLYFLGFGFFVGFLLVDFRFFGRFSIGLGFVGFSIVSLRLFVGFPFVLSNFYIGFIGIFLFGFFSISSRFFLGFSFVRLRSFARFLLLRLFSFFLAGIRSMLFRLLGRFFLFFLGSFIYFSRFLFFFT